MAKTNTAVFAQTTKTTATVLTAAINLTGAGSMADTANAVSGTSELLTAGDEGAIVTRISVTPRVTNTASVVMLFVQPADSPATTRILLDTLAIPAATLSATVGATRRDFVLANEASPIRLGAGDKLHVGMSVALAGGMTVYSEFTNF